VNDETDARYPRLKRLVVLAALFGGLCLAIMMLMSSATSFRVMPVFVSVRTNPPPQLAGVLGNHSNCFVSIPYAHAADKLVTPSDLDQIKQALPWSKTAGRLFRPVALVIDSPTEAHAEFWRRRKPLRVTLFKTGELWRVEGVYRGGQVDFLTPPGFLDKSADKLPF
jgi:hypothetical protein